MALAHFGKQATHQRQPDRWQPAQSGQATGLTLLTANILLQLLSRDLTCGSRTRPISDSSKPRPVRLNRRAPHSRYRALSCRLSSDWLLSRNKAARVWLPSLPTATKARHLCRSAAMSSLKSVAFCAWVRDMLSWVVWVERSFYSLVRPTKNQPTGRQKIDPQPRTTSQRHTQ